MKPKSKRRRPTIVKSARPGAPVTMIAPRGADKPIAVIIVRKH
jgi:hypothetical protein